MNAETVLITGGAGFIGSALAIRLAAEGMRVRLLDSLSPQIHGVDAAQAPRVVEAAAIADLQVGSVTSREQLERAIDGVDVIVHLAAETGTGQSMYQIARYAEVNVGGTAQLLDVLTAGNHRVRKVVVASSRAIYGEGQYIDQTGRTVYPGYRSAEQLAEGRFELFDPSDHTRTLRSVPTGETSRLDPSSIYGVTKLTQEQLVLTAAPALGIAGVALRYQNVYGPGQSLRNPYTGILSIFSTLIRQGAEINVFEDGLESRDFVFIDDVVTATRSAILEDSANGLAINVGSGVATSVLDVIAELGRTFGIAAQTRVSGNYRVGDIRHNVADLTLARRVLGFEPVVSFRDGIDQFVKWARGESLETSGYETSLEELRARSLLK